jgi:hypothetical protein
LTGGGPAPEVHHLVGELKNLRQGSAIVDAVGNERLSPTIRATFGLRDGDDAATVRARMLGRLRAALRALTDEEGAAVTVAFGLSPEYRGRYYKDRVEKFAEERDVNPRTVRRWVDSGLEPLARALLDAEAEPERGTGWWTDRLQLTLALDEPCVEALEIRRVVAARDGVTELDLAMTLTDAEPGQLDRVGFRMLYGGRLRIGPKESSDRLAMTLALPRPLRRGEVHEYALRVRLPEEFPLRRHCVCLPRYHCGDFDLRVRFPIDHPPAWVGRLVGVYQRDIDDDAVAAEQVPVDGVGEVHTAFTNLPPDRATGIRWRY